MTRRGLVGQGYMPKGGAHAARAHNEAVRAAGPVAPPLPSPTSPSGRGAVRVSARRFDRRGVWIVLGGGAAGLAAVASVVLR